MARSHSRHGANFFRPKTVQKTVPKAFDCPHCGEAIEFDDNFKPIAVDILSQPAMPPVNPPQVDTSSRLRHLLDEPSANETPAPTFEETPVVVTVQAVNTGLSQRPPNLGWIFAPATLTLAGALLFFAFAIGLGVVVYDSTAPKVTPVVNVSLPTRNPTKLAQQNKPVPGEQTQAPVFLPTATSEPATPNQTTGPDVNAPARTTAPDETQPTPEVLGPAVSTQQPSDTMGVASTGQGFGVSGVRGNPPGTFVPPSVTVTASTTLPPSPSVTATSTVTATLTAGPLVTISALESPALTNPLDAGNGGKLAAAVPTYTPSSPVLQVKSEAGWINQVVFSADGKMLATANADFTVRVWDATTGKSIKTFWGHTGSVYSLSFSPDGQYLASAGTDRSVILWDIATGNQVHKITGHTGGINSVAFSPGGQLLATGSSDSSVRLWDVNTGKQVGIAEGHQGPVQSVTFSPDGKRLASGSDDHTIMLWDLNSLSKPVQLATLKGHTSPVWMVTFSPDGQYLASASLETSNNLKIWDLNAGKELFNLTGHDQGVYSVAFSPNGKMLASGGVDRTVRMWDTATGNLLGTYTDSTGIVTSVGFSPDGKLLFGAGEDKVIRLWKVDAS